MQRRPVTRDQTLVFKRCRAHRKAGYRRRDVKSDGEQEALLSPSTNDSKAAHVSIEMNARFKVCFGCVNKAGEDVVAYSQIDGGNCAECQTASTPLYVKKLEQQELTPAWTGAAEEARTSLRAVDDKLMQLARMQEKCLRDIFADETAPDPAIDKLSSDICMLMKCCEQAIRKVEFCRNISATPSWRETQLVQNVQRQLATELNGLSQQFRTALRRYSNRVRERQRGGRWGSTTESRRDEVHDSLPSWQLQELDDMGHVAEQRSQGIGHLASTVVELNAIFKDMAVLVIDQGTVLDRIDYNIGLTVHNVTRAKDELTKAEAMTKSNRATSCMLVLALINFVLLTILVVKSRS